VKTPESIVKEIRSMHQTELVVLCINIALLIRSKLEVLDRNPIDDISSEFKTWLESLSAYELLLVQTGILERLNQCLIT
jgi:hypothetical protein